MAPEHIRGKPRPASDQYALGVIVYEWLCGRRPFQGDLLQIMYQQIHTAPPPLRDTVPMLSPDVERVVLQALNKDPELRFPSIEAFAGALEDAYQELPSGSVQSHTYHGHASTACALAWSPDAAHIVSTDYNERIHIWASTTGATFSVNNYAGYPSPVGAIAWSPDGKHIAFGNRNTAACIRTLATRHDQDFDGTRGKVDAIAWSPDGSRLASGSVGKVYGDNQAYVVQAWETKTGENIFTQYFYLPLRKGRDRFHEVVTQ